MNPPLLESYRKDPVVDPKILPRRGQSRCAVDEVSLVGIVTLVLWLGCLAVGELGFCLPYAHPHLPAKEPEPIQVENLKIELTNEVPPPPDVAPPPPDVPQPPSALDAVTPPEAPAMIPVAKPNPAPAFALPVKGPTREVEAKQASHSRPAQVAEAAHPAVQHLTYGQGEGKQPAPDYPRESIIARQQGSVRIRFSVGEDGRVGMAQVVGSCPWPLLNQAALRAVRDRWRFQTGPARLYEVSVNFQLKQ